MSARSLSIKEAALESGMSAHTLRYYEPIGLSPAVARDASEQRRYTERDLGASLARGDEAIPERRAMLEARGRAVRERIGELETNLTAIDAKIALSLDRENERAFPCNPPQLEPALGSARRRSE